MTLEIIAIIFSILTPFGSFFGSWLLMKRQEKQLTKNRMNQLLISFINKFDADSPENLLDSIKNNKEGIKELFDEMEK